MSTNVRCAEATLHDHAIEHVLAGEPDRARHLWLTFMRQFKGAKYVPMALVGLAEVVAEAAPRDASKWAVAGKFYEEALSRNAVRLRAYATYRLAETFVARGERLKARIHVANARDNAQQHPGSAAAVWIAAKAFHTVTTDGVQQ